MHNDYFCIDSKVQGFNIYERFEKSKIQKAVSASL